MEETASELVVSAPGRRSAWRKTARQVSEAESHPLNVFMDGKSGRVDKLG